MFRANRALVAGPTGQRRVLMVCYYYPPISSSGTSRSAAFAENLRTLGWTPIILTVSDSRDPTLQTLEPEPEGVACYRTPELNLAGLVNTLQGIVNRPFKLFGKTLKRNLFRECLCIPDDQIAWLSVFRGLKLARDADLVYVSCSPFSSAITGCWIGRLRRLPVVIDFRDAWSLNPYGRLSQAQRRLAGVLERWVIRHCSALILNTPGAESLYRRAYPASTSKMLTVPNGYDRLNLAAPRMAHEPFEIMHIGEFYGSRTPRLLLEAMVEANEPAMVFTQVGPAYSEFQQFNSRLRLRVTGTLPRAEALELMNRASLLYLKQGREPGVTDYIAVGAKTYEYVASGLPILADCPDGDNADIIRRYAANAHVVTSGNTSDLVAALRRAFAARASVVPAVKPEFARDFSRLALTQKLASLFEGVVAEAGHAR